MDTAYRLVELQGHLSWDPSELLLRSFEWPTEWPLERLSEITQRLTPRVLVNAGTPVITPDSIDKLYGGVRNRTLRYQGSAFQVGRDPEDLRPGDLILPKRPKVPPILIGDSLVGAIISDDFYAFRPTEWAFGAVLWAVFASKSGMNWWQGLTFGHSRVPVTALDDARLPCPPYETQDRVQTRLVGILTRLENMEVEAPATWWSTADLRQLGWQLALATPSPEEFTTGNPTSHYATVVAGKPVDRELLHDSNKPGLLAVVTGGVLAGVTQPRWTERAPRFEIAQPGDVLVAAIGERPHARVVENATVIDSSVYLLRPTRTEHALKIASYLNSREGQARRQIMLSGAVIPRISLRQLRDLPIPERHIEAETMNVPLVPLADELENELWSR